MGGDLGQGRGEGAAGQRSIAAQGLRHAQLGALRLGGLLHGDRQHGVRADLHESVVSGGEQALTASWKRTGSRRLRYQ